MWDFCSDELRRAFQVFAGKVAARYKGRVKAYEIWNEPTYTMGNTVYANLLKAAYPPIKAADPAATVIAEHMCRTVPYCAISL